jgi:hypothetical protein
MSTSNLIRGSGLALVAGWSAHISAVASILGFVFIAIFIVVGQPFGTLNNIFGGVVLGPSIIPTALALHKTCSPLNPRLSVVALVFGPVSIVILAVAAVMVILKSPGAITVPDPRPGTGPFGVAAFGPGLLEVWLIIISDVGMQRSTFPNHLNWIGIVARAGYVTGIIGFAPGGLENPPAAVGGLVAAIAYPIWVIWQWRLLLANGGVA